MAFEVHTTAAFEEDVEATLAYLSGSLGSPAAAESLMEAIDQAELLLRDQPFIHAVSGKSGCAEHAYRTHCVKNYVIVYKVEGDEVWLLRLFHQTQLYERFVMDWS